MINYGSAPLADAFCSFSLVRSSALLQKLYLSAPVYVGCAFFLLRPKPSRPSVLLPLPCAALGLLLLSLHRPVPLNYTHLFTGMLLTDDDDDDAPPNTFALRFGASFRSPPRMFFCFRSPLPSSSFGGGLRRTRVMEVVEMMLGRSKKGNSIHQQHSSSYDTGGWQDSAAVIHVWIASHSILTGYISSLPPQLFSARFCYPFFCESNFRFCRNCTTRTLYLPKGHFHPFLSFVCQSQKISHNHCQ